MGDHTGDQGARSWPARLGGLADTLSASLDEARARRIANAEDARRAARRVLPRVLFDFVDGGADDEVTLAANRAAFRQVTLRPRQAVAVDEPDLTARVLGADLALPVALAPCGGSRLVHPDGERALVRGANACGTAATMSTASATSPEDVAAAATGPVWFQLYYPGTREAARDLVERVRTAGFSALFVTVDLPVRGNQERVRSAERVVPPRPTLANAVRFGPQLALRPRWTLGYVRDGMTSGVPSDPARPGVALLPGRRPERPAVTWADLEFVREVWDGPLVVKGVLTAGDARRALECGADGLVVSNHGGRQLDGAPASLAALPEVRAAVPAATEVLLDGGVRRGTDVVKALAYGASAVLVGRPYLYGLAVAGEAGVRRVLDRLRDELERTLVLLGRSSVAEIDRSCVEASEDEAPPA